MQHDPETGEVMAERDSLPKMPPEIAAAIFQVKAGIKQIGFDERNEHSKYSYASVDKFYAALRPLEVEAGLEVMLDESALDVRAGDSGKGWAFITYNVWLLHKSGAMWGPLKRHLALPVTGAQTFGAAESYIHKAFRRGFYMVPTGEKDADDMAQTDSPPVSRASRATPVVAATGPSRDVAVAIAARIRSDIKNAASIEQLNRTGIWSPQRDADEKAILAQQGGVRVWDSLVKLDVERRTAMVEQDGGFPDDPIPDLAPEPTEYRI